MMRWQAGDGGHQAQQYSQVDQCLHDGRVLGVLLFLGGHDLYKYEITLSFDVQHKISM